MNKTCSTCAKHTLCPGASQGACTESGDETWQLQDLHISPAAAAEYVDALNYRGGFSVTRLDSGAYQLWLDGDE